MCFCHIINDLDQLLFSILNYVMRMPISPITFEKISIPKVSPLIKEISMLRISLTLDSSKEEQFLSRFFVYSAKNHMS